MSARRPGSPVNRDTPEVVRLLESPGCVLCRTRDAVADTWLRWFALENHGDAQLLSALHDSVGFCPAHTRRVLGLNNPAAVRHPWEFVLRSAIARATQLVDGQSPASSSPCPTCAVVAGRASAETRFLLESLGQADVREQLMTNAGLCVPHGGEAVASLEPEYAAVVASAVGAALAGDAPVEVAAGTDADAGLRAGLVRRTANDVATEDNVDLSPRDRLVVELLAGACPCCRARGRAQVRYLCWLTTCDDARAPVALDSELCGVHLHDLLTLAGVGCWAIAARRDAVRARVARFADAAAALAARAPTRRGRFTVGRRRAPTDDADGSVEHEYAIARWNLAASVRCRACAAGDTGDERCRSLLAAGVGDARVRRALDDGHGVCLRHAERLPTPYRERLLTQLRLIAWELDEDIRKQAWDTRHEPPGREVTAWRRVPMFLDGMAYLGRSDGSGDDGEMR